MRFVAAIEQRGRKRWKRVAGGALTAAVLLAVVVVGLSLLGRKALAAWKTPGTAEQVLASGDAFVGLVNFGGPAVAVTRFKIQTEEAETSIRNAENAVLHVRNWKFTQSPVIDALGLSLNLYSLTLQAEIFLTTFNNFIEQVQSGLAANPSPLAQFLTNVLEGFQMQVNALLTAYINTAATLQSFINSFIPASIRPPPIPPASPCGC